MLGEVDAWSTMMSATVSAVMVLLAKKLSPLAQRQWKI